MTSAHAQCAFLGTFPFESMEAEIAKLLNFNGNDREHLTDLFNKYLSNPWEENSETDKTNDDSSSLDCDDEFDPRLSGFDSVMQNEEVIAEYASCTAETIDEVEWEKAIKFRFDANHPGIVFAKYDTEGEEVAFPVLLPNATFPTGEATVIQQPGLSLQRQEYLFKSIREFVEDPFKDIVCPRPEEMMPEEINVTNRGRGSAGGRGSGGANRRGRGGAAGRGVQADVAVGVQTDVVVGVQPDVVVGVQPDVVVGVQPDVVVDAVMGKETVVVTHTRLAVCVMCGHETQIGTEPKKFEK